MSAIWILWAYLAGIPIWWAATARWLGMQLDAIKAWSVRRSKASYPGLNSRLDAEQGDGWAYTILFGALLFIGAGIWPVLLPSFAFFARGRNLAGVRKEITKRMKAAEAEIERIRQQEGWAK